MRNFLSIFTVFLLLASSFLISCGGWNPASSRDVPVKGMDRAKKNIEEGKYKHVSDYRGNPIDDFETFRTAGARSIRFLILAPRERYSIED